MKSLRLLPVFILLLAGGPAWAKRNPPRPFMLPEEVDLNGAQVSAGRYELTWENQGSSARVTLSKDGRFVATAQGSLVKNGTRYSEDAALLRVNSDGSKSLIEIRIAGSNKAIVIKHSEAMVHYSAMKR